MSEIEDAERIRQRMKRIRQHLDHDVDGLLSNAQQMLDWRYYIRRHPWTSLAAAVAAGFLLVPGRRRPQKDRIYLDADAARELASHHEQFTIEKSSASSSNFVQSIVMMAANALVRAGLAYMGQQLGKVLGDGPGEQAAADPVESSSRDRQ